MKKIFIGSSKESTPIAEELASVIGTIEDVVVDIWDQVMQISDTTMEDLTNNLRNYSGAIFIFGADDTLISRGKEYKVPRDNVLFEYGLFIGALGQKRVAIAHIDDVKIMSDVHTTYIPYEKGLFVNSRARIRKWINSLPDILGVDDYELNHRIYDAKNELMMFEYTSPTSCVFTNPFDAVIKCDHLRIIDCSYSWIYGGDLKVKPINPQDELIFEKIENRNTRYGIYLNEVCSHGDVHHTGLRFDITNISKDISTCHLNYDCSYARVSPVVLKVKIPDNMEFVMAKSSFRDGNHNIFPCDSTFLPVNNCKEIEYGNNIILGKDQGISLEWTVKFLD